MHSNFTTPKFMYASVKRFSFFMMMPALLVLALAGCNGEAPLNGEDENDESQQRVREIAVETITLRPDGFDDLVRISGSVEAIDDAVISAEVGAQVLSIVDRGTIVQRGDVIAELDKRMLRANLDAAEASFEFADETVNRLQPLFDDEVVSVQDFRAARTERDAAKAQLDQAQKALQDATIRAPFDGRVEQRRIRAGELINPGMPVARIVNSRRVRIVSGVPERFSNEIGPGSTVFIDMAAYGAGQIEDEISFAGNVIDPDRRTYQVEIELDNPEQFLKPDMVVNLRLKRRTIEDAIIIPRTAIIRDEEHLNVFVARPQENGNGYKQAELVRIETGTASGRIVEVLSGLSSGDEVVVAGMSNISVGDRLNIIANEDSNERARRLQQNDRPVVTFD